MADNKDVFVDEDEMAAACQALAEAGAEENPVYPDLPELPPLPTVGDETVAIFLKKPKER